MKFGPLARVGLVVLIVVLAAVAFWYIDRVPRERLAALLGVTLTVSDLSGNTPSPSPSSLPLTDQLPALSRGTVVIQSFAGTRVMRTGAGTPVSADGLIVTTAAGAPYGDGTYRYQVMTADGTVARAFRVAYDARTGLVLLKAEADLQTVAFDETIRPVAGYQLTAVAALLEASRYVPVILPLSVPYVNASGVVALSLDRNFAASAYGARVVDSRGTTIGLLSPATAPWLIGASEVNAFVEAYLERQ